MEVFTCRAENLAWIQPFRTGFAHLEDWICPPRVFFWLVTPALPTWICGDVCILLCRSSQLCQVGWGHSQVSRGVCLGSLSVVTETTANARCVFRVIVLLECDPLAQFGVLAAVEQLIRYTPPPPPSSFNSDQSIPAAAQHHAAAPQCTVGMELSR